MKLLRERQERMILIESSASAMEITESESDVQCTPDKFDLAGYNRYNLDADKMHILSNNWEPGDYKFPSRKFGKQFRHFQSSWLRKWPFLRYSKSKDGVYCCYCFIFRLND